MAWPPRNAAVRAAGPADTIRPIAGAARLPRRVDVLPRPARFTGGHAAANRAADRAVCSGLSATGDRPRGHAPGRYRTTQCQSGWRGYWRRPEHCEPAVCATHVAHLFNAGTRAVHLFGVDPSWPERAWNVRLLRGAARTA